MPWKICVHPEFPIVETSYTGIIAPKEMFEAARETISIAHEKGVTRLLSDCTAFKGGHTVFDLYTLAEDVKADRISRVLKEAIIIPEGLESVQLVRFWETTCANRGITVRIFNDRQGAIDWLMKG